MLPRISGVQMSYKWNKETVEGVRKVYWDRLWHVLYTYQGKATYDRVPVREAKEVLKRMASWRKYKPPKVTQPCRCMYLDH